MGGRYLKACGGWEGDYSIDIFLRYTMFFLKFPVLEGESVRILLRHPLVIEPCTVREVVCLLWSTVAFAVGDLMGSDSKLLTCSNTNISLFVTYRTLCLISGHYITETYLEHGAANNCISKTRSGQHGHAHSPCS
jgi:hypothetical protein